MAKDILTLWIVSACNNTYCELCPVYAHDEQEARVQATDWLREHYHLPQLDFRECLNGFVIHHSKLPGKIEVER